jgi:hypothetical protein
MVLLRRVRAIPAASPEVSDEVAEFNQALSEERSNRRAQNSVAAAPEPQRRYRNIQEILDNPGHNMPMENQLTVHPDALPYAIRDLAARGLTDDAIKSEIGAQSIATVRRLRAHLRCEAPSDDLPPEAA